MIWCFCLRIPDTRYIWFDLLSIFPFPVCNNVTMDIDETSVNAVLSLLLAFTKHLLTRHIFYLRFGNSYRLTPVFLPGWQNCCCKHERKRKKLKKTSWRVSFAKESKQEKLIEAILCEDDCKTERHGQFVFCWAVWGGGGKKKHCWILLDQQAWLHFLQCCTLYFAQESKDSKAA